MNRRRAMLVAGCLLSGGAFARAQQPATAEHIEVRGAPNAAAPSLIAAELARPAIVVGPDTAPYHLAPGVVVESSLVVLGRGAVIEGRVRGDVIVIGGDVYVHPGAVVGGRVVAAGGGAYPSMLASLGGGSLAFPDFTYDVTHGANGYLLTYRALAVEYPASRLGLGLGALALPAYDRSDGLSLGVAPQMSLTRALSAEPSVIYRSQLGRLDPGLRLADSLGSANVISLDARRTTASNEEWIRSDLVNSLETLATGEDARNYYRTVRGRVALNHDDEYAAARLHWAVGVQLEHDTFVRPDTGAEGGPWSLVGRHGANDMLRPNPPLQPANALNLRVASLVAGVDGRWTLGATAFDVRLDNEIGSAGQDVVFGTSGVGAILPPGVTLSPPPTQQDFAQTTFDLGTTVPAGGERTITARLHALVTWAGAAPVARWSYLGGHGTIPTMDLLSEGGDELLFTDLRYNLPLTWVSLPVAGSPVLSLRNVAGSAGVGRLPTLHDAFGVRAAVSALYAEYMYEPRTRIGRAGAGLSLAR